MSYVDVNGLHMYYETEGSGRPLVLIHGGLMSASMFGPMRTELAKARKVIAVDLQGHGRTADIDRPLHPKAMAGDIVALIEQQKLGRVDLMGNSLGAGVALWVAILRPDLVRKVVACSTVLRRDAFYPDILAQQGQVNANAAEMMKQTPMYREYAKVASVKTASGARTGLLVPELRTIFVAVPKRSGQQAEIREYTLPEAQPPGKGDKP